MNGGHRAARGHLGRLVRKIQLFGLHLVPLEIREDAGRYTAAISELFARYNIAEDYESLSEEERQQVLLQEINNQRPLFPDEPDFLGDDERNHRHLAYDCHRTPALRQKLH